MILLTYFKNMKYSKYRGNSYRPSVKFALRYIEKVLNMHSLQQTPTFKLWHFSRFHSTLTKMMDFGPKVKILKSKLYGNHHFLK